jgi:hypothetical protein
MSCLHLAHRCYSSSQILAVAHAMCSYRTYTTVPDNIARWQHDYASELRIALISRGTPDANRIRSSEHGLAHVLIQEDSKVAQGYQAYGTPTAVLVHPDGTIGSPLAAGADTIAPLVRRALDGVRPAPPSSGPG